MRSLLVLAAGTMLASATVASAQTVVMRRPLSDMTGVGPGAPSPVPTPGTGTPTPSPTPAPTPGGGGLPDPDPAPTDGPIVADWVQGGFVADVPSCSETAPAHREMTCRSASGSPLADSYCTGARPVVAGTVADHTGCSYAWSVGEWSDWSSTCSPAATRTRTVECRRSDGALALRPTMCSDVYPRTTEEQALYTDCGGVLRNADFETGTMAGWTGGTISTVRKSGSYAGTVGSGLSQTVRTGAIAYSLSFHCYATGGYPVRVSWNGVQVGSCRGAGAGNPAWSTVPTTASVVGTGGDDVLSFSSSGGGRIVDDVVLSPRP